MTLKNPFLVYIGAFGSVLLAYQLGWSEIYPEISWSMLLFFAWTFLAASLLAVLIAPAISETNQYVPGFLPPYTVVFVVVTFAIELWLSRGIPLLLVLGGRNFFEMEAGASHLHVFTVWSVFSTVRFADFIYSRRRRYLIEASIPIIAFVLMVYRGPTIMTLVSWAFIFVIRHNLRARHVAAIGGVFLLILLGNGIIGDVRSPGQETVGVPSKKFEESGIPRNFFWGYLYATVPLANFQQAVDQMDEQKGTALEFIVSELVPDTFSKKILPLLNDNIASNQGNLISRDQLYSWVAPLVAPRINTTTVFGRSYGYFGWAGPVVMFVVLAAFSVLYLILIRDSPYCVPCLALLNTLIVFCLINNMIASAAMIPQLVWPLLLPPWRRASVKTC